MSRPFRWPVGRTGMECAPRARAFCRAAIERLALCCACFRAVAAAPAKQQIAGLGWGGVGAGDSLRVPACAAARPDPPACFVSSARPASDAVSCHRDRPPTDSRLDRGHGHRHLLRVRSGDRRGLRQRRRALGEVRANAEGHRSRMRSLSSGLGGCAEPAGEVGERPRRTARQSSWGVDGGAVWPRDAGQEAVAGTRRRRAERRLRRIQWPASAGCRRSSDAQRRGSERSLRASRASVEWGRAPRLRPRAGSCLPQSIPGGIAAAAGPEP